MALFAALLKPIVDFMQSGPGVLAFSALTVIAWAPLVLIHELGHALTMRVVYGGRVRIELGSGAPVIDTRLGEFDLRVNRIPRGGRTSNVAPIPPGAGVREHLLVIAGGPAASLLFGIIAARWASLAHHGSAAHAVLWVAAFGGYSHAIQNLVPFERVYRSGERVHSDGAQILRLVRIARTGPTVVRRAPSPVARRMSRLTVIAAGILAVMAVVAIGAHLVASVS
jgi:hypothetical protein